MLAGQQGQAASADWGLATGGVCVGVVQGEKGLAGCVLSRQVCERQR